jgi:hypothetical protein
VSIHDLLEQYCIALDTGDDATMRRILRTAETNPELEDAIVDLHNHFSSYESFTEQLQRRSEVTR